MYSAFDLMEDLIMFLDGIWHPFESKPIRVS